MTINHRQGLGFRTEGAHDPLGARVVRAKNAERIVVLGVQEAPEVVKGNRRVHPLFLNKTQLRCRQAWRISAFEADIIQGLSG
jgi:hypothetical protein